jgi:hypothetical protein
MEDIGIVAFMDPRFKLLDFLFLEVMVNTTSL